MAFSNGAFGGRPERVRESVKVVTCNVANTTGSKTVFTVTGSVLIHAIWAEVTTILSNNHTAAHLRLNDQTATVDITLAAGVTLSSLAVGSIVARTGQVDVALAKIDNAVGAISDAVNDALPVMSPALVTKKSGAATTVDYRYTTTNNPSTGGLTFHAVWEPISADGNLAAT